MNNWVIMYTTADGMQGEFITAAVNRIMALDNFEEYIKDAEMVIVAATCAPERD